MAEIYIPNYMSFNNDNIFLGSYQGLRFKLTPDVAEQTIHAEYWYGPLSYENSTMDGQRQFDLTQEAIDEMTQWLIQLAESGKDGAL